MHWLCKVVKHTHVRKCTLYIHSTQVHFPQDVLSLQAPKQQEAEHNKQTCIIRSSQYWSSSKSSSCSSAEGKILDSRDIPLNVQPTTVHYSIKTGNVTTNQGWRTFHTAAFCSYKTHAQIPSTCRDASLAFLKLHWEHPDQKGAPTTCGLA